MSGEDHGIMDHKGGFKLGQVQIAPLFDLRINDFNQVGVNNVGGLRGRIKREIRSKSSSL